MVENPNSSVAKAFPEIVAKTKQFLVNKKSSEKNDVC
jgi:hypothetical protein